MNWWPSVRNNLESHLISQMLEENQRMSNRTGLRDSLAVFKEKARVARERSLQASDKIAAAFAHQEAVTQSLNQYADDVLKEANDVLSELGQFSNGGPALEETYQTPAPEMGEKNL